MHTIIPKLKNGKYIPLNLQRENIDNKFNDGILNFTAYEIFYKNRRFVLKCAVKRNGAAKMTGRNRVEDTLEFLQIDPTLKRLLKE